MTIQRVLTADKIVEIETVVKEYDRVVDFHNILDSVSVDYDDWHNEAPWDSCDGWDHEVESVESFDGADLDDLRECRGYVRGDRYTNGRIISIDDADIVKKWGCEGYNGMSKQARAEYVATVKRKALDQLVKWYEEGWHWYSVCGDYQDYTASLSGIDCREYAEEVRMEIADEIAGQMQDDGYAITNRPKPQEPYNPAKANRENKRRMLESYVVST